MKKLTWCYLNQEPKSTGVLRQQIEDFVVDEQLGFDMSGDGEQLALLIEKRGENTDFIADQLASFFKVKRYMVSYSGKKDRHAVTRQWFTIHLPGQNVDVMPEFEGCKILEVTRHNRKLRLGSHKANRFTLTLRDVTDKEDVEKRLLFVSQHGVPNYFGEQRFGRDGGNLDKALAMFSGLRIKSKNKSAMYLSAARSWVFNNVVEARIQENTFYEPIEGDVFQMQGSNAIFADVIDDAITTRLNEQDIHITAPLYGRGEGKVSGEALAFEQSQFALQSDICEGLDAAGLKMERRAMRLMPLDMTWEWSEGNLVVSFGLPSGTFATSVLREVLRYTTVDHAGTANTSN